MQRRFRDCIFDSDARQLLRAGRPVHLSPKAYGLLELLLRQAPKALSKDEIQAVVWGQTFLSESTLTNVVTEIRAAIGDRARQPGLLRTVHGFGYAFSGAMEDESDAEVSKIPRFRLLHGRRTIELLEGENVIGRDPDVRVSIDHASVSRRHARISIVKGRAAIEDLGSRNGTFRGGQRVEAVSELEDGDIIALGPVTLVFEKLATPGTTKSDVRG